MTETFSENVLIDGSADDAQLRVQGHTSQTEPLQTWEDSSGDVLAQVTGDGRLQIGDDVGFASPDALVEAHRAEGSTSKPKRAFHALGRVSNALDSIAQWIVEELEVHGSDSLSALQTALRVRAANMNTGTPSAGAELRAVDIEVSNDAMAGSAALPKATGLHVGVTNAAGKTIEEAVGLHVKLDNAGTINNPYAIYTEGEGAAHFDDYLEVKRPASVPGTPDNDLIRIYPKSDGNLYFRNWSGMEHSLIGNSSLPAFGVGVSRTLSSGAATAGSDRHLVLSAETGTADDLIEITGLSAGDEVIVRAASGHTITVKHNDGSATDKIILYNEADIALSGDQTLKLVKIGSGKVVQCVDEKGAGGNGTAIPSQGAIAGLEVDVTSSTQLTIAPGQCRDGANTYTITRTTAAGNITVDITASGANGLDTGSEANSVWYAVWIIAKSSDGAIAGLLSTSATSPTMPTGYDVKRRVGWARNDSSGNLWQMSTIRGAGNLRNVIWRENSETGPRILNNVSVPTALTWLDVDCSPFAPPTSRAIDIKIMQTANVLSDLIWREKDISNQVIGIHRFAGVTGGTGIRAAMLPIDVSQYGQISNYQNVSEAVYVLPQGYWDNLLPVFI